MPQRLKTSRMDWLYEQNSSELNPEMTISDLSSSSVSHGLPTRRTKLLKSFKLQHPDCPYFSLSFKNPFTFLNIKKCFRNGVNCWDFLAKTLQHSSGKRKELHFKNKPYKSTLFLASVINTISYTIRFKDALVQVLIPLRAHILAQIILFVLWNSERPVWFIWFSVVLIFLF